MKVLLRLIDPSVGFLLGLDFTDGYIINEETSEQTEVKMFSFGFLLIEVSIIWTSE